MTTLRQHTFASGEISPSVQNRTDITKYMSGLKTCRNMMVAKHGGAFNRPGTEFIAEIPNPGAGVRLVEFIFSSSVTYVLEFGVGYIRFYKNGAQILDGSSQAITAITSANPCVITYTGADNFSVGDEVYIEGVVGTLGFEDYFNGRNFVVAAVDTALNKITLDYLDGDNVDSSGFTGVYSSGGTVQKVYEVATDFIQLDLYDLQFAQSADVMTIAHDEYPVQTLTRTGDASWTLADVSFQAAQPRPTGLSQSNSGAGTATVQYVVTAITESGGESLPATGTQRTITAITSANPCVITVNRATKPETLILPGDVVLISGVDGNMTSLNNRYFRVGEVGYPTGTTQQITLLDEDTSAIAPWTGTTGLCTSHSVTAINALAPITITWSDSSTNVRTYNVYRRTILSNGVVYYPWGLITTVAGKSYADAGTIAPDYNFTPPDFLNKFTDAENYPGVVAYFQQRLILASTDSSPELVKMSKTGDFYNFSIHSPIQDDDAIEFTMAGRQISDIKHIIDIGKCIMFTDSGEWVLNGDQSGAITPSAINPTQQSYNGSSSVPPLIVDNNALYVQGRGSIVRDLNYDYQVEGYKGNDLTTFAYHLLEGKTIVDWAYQKTPNSIVWIVLDDGSLVALTYIKEQQILAWHRHDIAGATRIESVCCVPEGNEDSVYIVVHRTINNESKAYLERLTTRVVSDQTGMRFMDSAISYDGTNTDLTNYMILTGSGWTYTDTLTLTANVANTFESEDIGKEIHLNGVDADGEAVVIRFTIDAYSTDKIVTGRPDRTVPTTMRTPVQITDWAMAISTIKGLWHLEGEDLSVLGDGYVVASPNNDQYTVVTVSGGQATLDRPYAIIHAGLPYISDVETLNIDTDSAESIADKKMLVNKVSVHVESTRGMFAGGKPPTDDTEDPLEGLTEFKIRNTEGYDDPVALKTGVVSINIKPEWNSNGRVFIRQVDPLPMGILSIMPTGLYPLPGRR